MEYKKVEISGRQTGKTQRLLEQLKDDFYKDQGKCFAMVFVRNNGHKQELLDRLEKMDKYLYDLAATTQNNPNPGEARIEICPTNGSYSPEMICHGRGNFRLYCDDFDEYDWTNRDLEEFKYTVWGRDVRSIYGLTTPMYLRNPEKLEKIYKDIIAFFLEITKGEYKSFTNLEAIKEDRRNRFTTEVNKREIFGEFIKWNTNT